MNGLPFQQLPAHEYKQLPNPEVQRIKSDLGAQYKIEADALNKSWFSNRGQYDTVKAKLDAKYKQKEYEELKKLQSKIQEEEQVRQLIKQRTGQGLSLKPEEEAMVRMNLRPEAEKLVFPQPTNWATKHSENLRERNRLLDIVESFTVSPGGKVKFKQLDNKGNIIEDRRATNEEVQLFQNATKALANLEKQEREEIIPNLSGIERLATQGQEIIQGRREKDFWQRHKYLRLIPQIGIPALTSHVLEKIGQLSPLEQSLQTGKPEQKQRNVIRQRNARTGQERVSYDGGKTWQIIG